MGIEIKDFKNFKVKGITKRWIRNVLLLIFIVVLLIEVFGAIFVSQYFYDQTEKTLNIESDKAIAQMAKSNIENSQEFMVSSRLFAENFTNKDKMELIVFTSRGVEIASSSGITYHNNENKTADVKYILDGKGDVGKYTGKNKSGEKIMSISTAYKGFGDDESMGIITISTSLENIDLRILHLILIFIVIGIVVLLLFSFSGYYFIKSIIAPLSGINQAARKIALGDFSIRLPPGRNDEIGDLCDTINYMAKELGENEKIKNDFVSSVSHELRTPLTAIKGWAETVKNSDNKEITEKGMDIITREATRLSGLLEDLLDFSHLETGELKINFSKVDIYAELSEAVYVYERQAKEQGITLKYKEPYEVVSVLGDSNRLRQVFINIIDNAVKYSKENGEVEILTEHDTDFVKITVSDNGVGIPAQDIANVKEKFYKVNHTVKGSGIGLAVADEIISHHNGNIDITSLEGEGTKVIVTLPIDKTTEVTEAELIEKVEMEEKNEL
jgi:signal transduction histidine kinase